MKLAKLRVARPSSDFSAARRFYVDGLGLTFAGAFAGHADYDGELYASADGRTEIEVTRHPRDRPCAAPSPDHLIVFYLASRAELDAVAERLAALGVVATEPLNPYWRDKSFTFLDPDGWPVVVFDASTRPG